jgi:hypothetical protein
MRMLVREREATQAADPRLSAMAATTCGMMLFTAALTSTGWSAERRAHLLQPDVVMARAADQLNLPGLANLRAGGLHVTALDMFNLSDAVTATVSFPNLAYIEDFDSELSPLDVGEIYWAASLTGQRPLPGRRVLVNSDAQRDMLSERILGSATGLTLGEDDLVIEDLD